MSDGAGPTLDRGALDNLRADVDDDELVAQVIASFVADTPGQIASLAAAGERRDHPVVVSLAHRIKGSALTLGAVRLAQLCGELEAAPGGSGERVPAVARELEALTGSLSDYLDNDLRPQ
jgi:HPt (histidine-containing phosphotransfer) domain-containing protein